MNLTLTLSQILVRSDEEPNFDSLANFVRRDDEPNLTYLPNFQQE